MLHGIGRDGRITLCWWSMAEHGEWSSVQPDRMHHGTHHRSNGPATWTQVYADGVESLGAGRRTAPVRAAVGMQGRLVPQLPFPAIPDPTMFGSVLALQPCVRGGTWHRRMGDGTPAGAATGHGGTSPATSDLR